MLSLEAAKQTRFQSSTTAELRGFCDELGVKWHHKHKDDSLRDLLCRELGIASGYTPKVMPKIVSGGTKIFPDYNLSAVGIWGGLRFRIKLQRPDGVKIARAEPFSFNGKHPYWVPYDKVEAVPAPIYYRIKDGCKKMRPQPLDQGNGEITTTWEETEGYNFSDYGPDPVTADRCDSLAQWYQLKGPEWFDGLTEHELRLIAGKIEHQTKIAPGKLHERDMTEQELRGSLKQFFFGFADAKSEPRAA